MQSKNKQRLLETLNTDQYFKLFSDLFSKNFLSADARNEFKKIEKREHEINDLINKTGNKTIRSFETETFSRIVTLNVELEVKIDKVDKWCDEEIYKFSESNKP